MCFHTSQLSNIKKLTRSYATILARAVRHMKARQGLTSLQRVDTEELKTVLHPVPTWSRTHSSCFHWIISTVRWTTELCHRSLCVTACNYKCLYLRKGNVRHAAVVIVAQWAFLFHLSHTDVHLMFSTTQKCFFMSAVQKQNQWKRLLQVPPATLWQCMQSGC